MTIRNSSSVLTAMCLTSAPHSSTKTPGFSVQGTGSDPCPLQSPKRIPQYHPGAKHPHDLFNMAALVGVVYFAFFSSPSAHQHQSSTPEPLPHLTSVVHSFAGIPTTSSLELSPVSTTSSFPPFQTTPDNPPPNSQNAFHDLCCWSYRPGDGRRWPARPRAVHCLQHRDGHHHLVRRHGHRLPGSLDRVSHTNLT